MYSDREPFKCHIHLSDNPQNKGIWLLLQKNEKKEVSLWK
jgi:hypothetical protein